MQRVIAHIDLNSFFASCEQQDNQLLRGRPLGVCEHLGGIIIAPSVEAKTWGVKTGMPVWEAKKLCPQIILTRTKPDRYRFYATKFFALLSDYTDIMEKYSIDEAFLDLTKSSNIVRYEEADNGSGTRVVRAQDPFQEAVVTAKEIKQRLSSEVGDWLKCSVGISFNKLIAKIASDLHKPDGLVVVKPEDKYRLYDKLKLTDVPGIASGMSKRLLRYGLRTLKDLRDCPRSHLISWFGINGEHLWRMGQLQGFYGELFVKKEQKSIGHVYTIAKEYRSRRYVGFMVLARLSEFLARRLRSLGLFAGEVSVFMSGKDGDLVSGVAKLGGGTSIGSEIYAASSKIIRDGKPIPKEVVRVGITANRLTKGVMTEGLFKDVAKGFRLAKVLDLINVKYAGGYDWQLASTTASLGSTPSFRGQDVLLPGVAFFAKDIIRDSVGFGRVNEMPASLDTTYTV